MESPHRNNFDGIRLAAALMVLWSHGFLLTGRAEPLLVHVRSPGHLAVLVFFSLSGYLVASSWASDPDLRRFLVRRLLRIWPAYSVVVVVLGIGAVFKANDDLSLMAAQHWFWNLAFDRFDWGFFRGTVRHELNGSLWTIPYEVECYVALAAVAVVAGRWLNWACAATLLGLLLAFASWGGQEALDTALHNWGTFPHLYYFGAFFAAGAILFHVPLGTGGVAAFLAGGAAVFATGQYELASLLLIPPVSICIGTASWPGVRSAGRFGDFSSGSTCGAGQCSKSS
jgi:peptidoglycan/LPS O-acetylase OafA/YrhL